jgi:hypothetical protein
VAASRPKKRGKEEHNNQRDNKERAGDHANLQNLKGRLAEAGVNI